MTALQWGSPLTLADDLGPKRLERPPLLVIEVLSPSTRRIDLATKRMAYADAGVAGYWLVDPDVPGQHAHALQEAPRYLANIPDDRTCVW